MARFTYLTSGCDCRYDTTWPGTLPAVRSAIVVSSVSYVQVVHAESSWSVSFCSAYCRIVKSGRLTSRMLASPLGVGDHQVGEVLGVGGRGVEATDDGDDALVGIGLVLTEHREHRDVGRLGRGERGLDRRHRLTRDGDEVGAGVDGLLHRGVRALRVRRVVGDRRQVPADGLGGGLEAAGDRAGSTGCCPPASRASCPAVGGASSGSVTGISVTGSRNGWIRSAAASAGGLLPRCRRLPSRWRRSCPPTSSRCASTCRPRWPRSPRSSLARPRCRRPTWRRRRCRRRRRRRRGRPRAHPRRRWTVDVSWVPPW